MRATVLLMVIVAATRLGAQAIEVFGPEPETVRLGESSRLEIRVFPAGGREALGSLPVVDGVEIRCGRPESVVGERLIDGVVKNVATTVWKVVLRPLRLGDFEIPPFAVDAGGTTLRTETLKLRSRRDEAGAKHAYVELVAPRRVVYLGEAVTIDVRVGYDEAFFRDFALSLSNRALDVPLQIDSKVLEPGRNERDRSPLAAPRPIEVAFGDGTVKAAEVGSESRDGRVFRVLSVTRTIVPVAVGALDLAGPTVRFAYATRFEDDILSGRRAVDRIDAFVYAEPVRLDVRPLPEESRPSDFSGAIGRFAIETSLERMNAKKGETIALTQRITGAGNFRSFGTPKRPDIPGFRILGLIEERAADGRTIVYDLSIEDAAALGVPPLTFPYFDPATGRYERAQSRPIPLAIEASDDPDGRAAAPAAAHPPKSGAVAGVNDIFDVKSTAALRRRDRLESLGVGMVLLVIGAAWFLALLLIVRGRKKEALPQGLATFGLIALLQAPPLYPADLAGGEAAYRAGRFADARAIFAAGLEVDDGRRGAVLYNLGNACYRLDRKAEALAHWRAADRLLPGDHEILFNLRLVARELGVEVRAAGARTIDALAAKVGAATILFGLAGLTILGAAIFRGRGSRWRTVLGAVLIVLAGSATAAILNARFGDEPLEAVAAAERPSIEVRDEPHRDQSVASTIKRGASVLVIERSVDWMRIELDGRRGWVESRDMILVR